LTPATKLVPACEALALQQTFARETAQPAKLRGDVFDPRGGPVMKKKAPLSFDEAKLKAESYVARKEKLRGLLEVASSKSERFCDSLLAPWESLQIFIRMIRSWAFDEYCAPAEVGSHDGRRRNLFREPI
jgi:hypothetical protein